MNEEALDVLFGLAKRDGYKKGKEDFTLLMSENEKAVDRMFILAKGDGYKKGKEDFKTLVGYGSNAAADPQKKIKTYLEVYPNLFHKRRICNQYRQHHLRLLLYQI